MKTNLARAIPFAAALNSQENKNNNKMNGNLLSVVMDVTIVVLASCATTASAALLTFTAPVSGFTYNTATGPHHR
jgi:hypothetical protein